MKNLVRALTATGLILGSATGAFGDDARKPTAPQPEPAKLLAQATPSASTATTSATTAEEKKKLELKKEKKKGPSFSPGFAIWQGWGYQSENPYFGTSIYFSPAFTISEKQRVSAFVGLSSEYTQPDDGRRVSWSNTFVTYTYDLWTPKWGKHKFKGSVGGQVILPTDEGARNRGTMRLAFGPLVRGVWSYGMLSVNARLSFLKYWNGSNVEERTSAESNIVNGVEVSPRPYTDLPRANPNSQLLGVVGFDLNFTKKLYFSTQAWLIYQFPYDIAGATPQFSSSNSQGVTRASYWAFGEVGYKFTKTFSLGFGFSLSASQLSPDGRNFYLPINNYNNNFTTYLSMSFSPKIDL